MSDCQSLLQVGINNASGDRITHHPLAMFFSVPGGGGPGASQQASAKKAAAGEVRKTDDARAHSTRLRLAKRSHAITAAFRSS